MQGRYKTFDKKLYDQTDILVRAAVSAHVQLGSGMFVKDNDDKYGPDLVVYKGLKPAFYLEVEVKRVWKRTQDLFPWDSIQLPERKEKFLKAGLPLEFWILREDLRMAIIIPDFVVAGSPKVEVPNKYIDKGELFFQIPITNCMFVELLQDPEGTQVS